MVSWLENKKVFHESKYGEGYISKYEKGKVANSDGYVLVVFYGLPKAENPKRFLFPTSFNKPKGALRFADERDQKLIEDIIQQKNECERLKQEQEQAKVDEIVRVVVENSIKIAEEERKEKLRNYNTNNRYNEKRFQPVEDIILSSFNALRDRYLAGDYIPSKDFPYLYGDSIDQNIYILRYIYAYTYEYQKMFERLLKMWGEKTELRMLSIGCGAMQDAWGLQEALAASELSCRAIYQGLDINKWNYSIKTRDDLVRKMPLRLEGAGTFFRDIDRLDYDVYCFPKSIGDIAGKDRQSSEYKYLLNAFKTKPICNDVLYIAASLINYSTEQMIDDTTLIDNIKSALEERGFRCAVIDKRIGCDMDGYISGSGYQMSYPIPNELTEILAGQKPTFHRRYERNYIYRFERGI